MKNVLFVCTGNTCRSPMAEGMFKRLVAGDASYEVGSAGTAAYDGDAMSAHTATLLAEAGSSIPEFRSRAVTKEILAAATHVFALSRGHLQQLERDFTEFSDKFYLVSEFSPNDAIRNRDVADPFGGSLNDYRNTQRMLQDFLPSLKQYIDRTSV